MSFFMLHVHVHAECSCPCRISVSVLHVHVHAAGVGYTEESRLTGVAYTGEFPFWLNNTAKIRRNLKSP
jgi:hypothetical protein